MDEIKALCGVYGIFEGTARPAQETVKDRSRDLGGVIWLASGRSLSLLLSDKRSAGFSVQSPRVHGRLDIQLNHDRSFVRFVSI